MRRESSHVMRRLAALGVAILSLAAATSWADPPTRAARLSFVSGDVSLAPASLPDEWGEALVNRPLTGGDRLWVAQGSRAELRAGSTAVRLDGGTGLDLLDYDDARVQVSVDQGRVQVRTRGGRGGDAEIDTPAAAIVVADAAEVLVAVDPSSGRTGVTVRQGRASVHAPRETLAIVAGDVLTVDGDGGDATLSRIGAPDAFESFAIARDAQWREPRYVSRDMTGYEDLDAYGDWQAVASYGSVWYPRSVPAGWAPYRDGRWVWVEPWGWSWVDNAPWGFAPFHYGRWVYVDSRWGWAPGAVVARPVYAPALVAFYGGADFGVSVAIGGGAVGWFPLGWGDPYVPWYATTPAYRRSVNVAYVRDPVVLNRVVDLSVTNVTTIRDYRYAYRETANAVTVVPRNAFVEAAPVRTAAVRIDPGRLRNASLVVGAAPAAPERRSVVAGSPTRGGHGMREARARPVVAVNAPPPAAGRFDEREAQARATAGKPFEVKPIAPRGEPAERSNGARGGTSVAGVDANRDVRVLAPARPGSVRQARDLPGAVAQEREAAPRQPAPTARATPPEAPKPREVQRESPAPSAARAAPPPAARDARRNEARASQGEADAHPHGPAPSAERGRSVPPAQASAPAPEPRAAAPREPQASAPPRESRVAREAPANRAPQREAAPQPAPQREASAPQRPQERKGKGEPDRGGDERAQGERGHGRSG